MRLLDRNYASRLYDGDDLVIDGEAIVYDDTAVVVDELDLSGLKLALCISDTDYHDERLKLALKSAIAKVEKDTRRFLKSTYFSEQFQKIDQDLVKIDNKYYHQVWVGWGPITEVLTAKIDGVTVTALDTWRVDGPLDTAVYIPQTVTGDLYIECVGGYDEWPDELNRAVLMLAAANFEDPLGGLNGERLAGYRAAISFYGGYIS